ncbi:response regulator transcription factor [Corynebacterium heidelbergense]|uniref:DNA-binding response regulator n=1 Tax=Corynebacterium heidelbergense TaxID=2055947 RepID=A0A364V4V2_9CORY|nr:response regulator transcription factor [Corynebacterium heidelbergense]RAV31673.1 DNA-binding response regulator [Corynebacterium heidelbergense]
MPIRVAIADDEELIASSLGTLLSLEEDIDLVRTCSSGEELVAWCATHPVDVCVVDFQMGGMDGVDTAERLRAQNENAAVMIVTSHARPRGLKRALRAGVRGFLPKTASAEEFAAAVRTVYGGRRHIDPDVAAAAIDAGESPLTDRETELLELAGRGNSVDELAVSVRLAPGTVRNYLSSAMAKLGAANRFDAYQRARERGWL